MGALSTPAGAITWGLSNEQYGDVASGASNVATHILSGADALNNGQAATTALNLAFAANDSNELGQDLAGALDDDEFGSGSYGSINFSDFLGYGGGCEEENPWDPFC